MQLCRAEDPREEADCTPPLLRALTVSAHPLPTKVQSRRVQPAAQDGPERGPAQILKTL